MEDDKKIYEAIERLKKGFDLTPAERQTIYEYIIDLQALVIGIEQ
jgi:hypothetical protein